MAWHEDLIENKDEFPELGHENEQDLNIWNKNSTEKPLKYISHSILVCSSTVSTFKMDNFFKVMKLNIKCILNDLNRLKKCSNPKKFTFLQLNMVFYLDF